jgi:hypothetical protein
MLYKTVFDFGTFLFLVKSIIFRLKLAFNIGMGACSTLGSNSG